MSLEKYLSLDLIGTLENNYIDLFKNKTDCEIEILKEISVLVDNLFECLFNELKDKKFLFLLNVERELLEKKIDLLPPNLIKMIFTEQLYIRNHMYSVKIDFLTNKNEIFMLDLEKLSEKISGAYFCKTKTPSMIIFDDEMFCCAIFTEKGNINIVGGCTEKEVKDTLVKFLFSIKNSISNTDVKMVLRGIKLHNLAVSTSLPATKIDIFNLTSYLEFLNVSHVYMPEVHDLLKVKPLDRTIPSAFVNIFPSGGIFCFGCKTIDEIKITVCVLATLMNNYRKVKVLSLEEYKLWKSNLMKRWKKLEENKRRRREKKIGKWDKIIYSNIKTITNND